MIEDIIKNGISPNDILLLLDYPTKQKYNAHVMHSSHLMPINWWHGVAAILPTDYVALLCDDLTLKPESLRTLLQYAQEHQEASVFGFEGGNFAKTDNPYTDAMSHTTDKYESAEYLIRFYFAKPEAYARALVLHHKLPEELRGHDDMTLSLANSCGLIPTTDECGWNELSEHDIAYSSRTTHYYERNKLVRKVRTGRI